MSFHASKLSLRGGGKKKKLSKTFSKQFASCSRSHGDSRFFFPTAAGGARKCPAGCFSFLFSGERLRARLCFSFSGIPDFLLFLLDCLIAVTSEHIGRTFHQAQRAWPWPKPSSEETKGRTLTFPGFFPPQRTILLFSLISLFLCVW